MGFPLLISSCCFQNGGCHFVHLGIILTWSKFFYDDDVFLINCSYKVTGFGTEQTLDALERPAVFIRICLKNKYKAACFHFNM